MFLISNLVFTRCQETLLSVSLSLGFISGSPDIQDGCVHVARRLPRKVDVKWSACTSLRSSVHKMMGLTNQLV